ncbi:hypothetical protein [Sanguibacter sp. Z1732]|uniref:hypothetical protein n=1 Tax=Sanguibacter sp. Z1732 TaxID=3435412 RepID=UPI003D9C8434
MTDNVECLKMYHERTESTLDLIQKDADEVRTWSENLQEIAQRIGRIGSETGIEGRSGAAAWTAMNTLIGELNGASEQIGAIPVGAELALGVLRDGGVHYEALPPRGLDANQQDSVRMHQQHGEQNIYVAELGRSVPLGEATSFWWDQKDGLREQQARESMTELDRRMAEAEAALVPVADVPASGGGSGGPGGPGVPGVPDGSGWPGDQGEPGTPPPSSTAPGEGGGPGPGINSPPGGTSTPPGGSHPYPPRGRARSPAPRLPVGSVPCRPVSSTRRVSVTRPGTAQASSRRSTAPAALAPPHRIPRSMVPAVASWDRTAPAPGLVAPVVPVREGSGAPVQGRSGVPARSVPAWA